MFLILLAGATYCDGKGSGRAYLPLAKEAVEQDSEPSYPLKDRAVQPARHCDLDQLKRDVSGVITLIPDSPQWLGLDFGPVHKRLVATLAHYGNKITVISLNGLLFHSHSEQRKSNL